MASIIEVSDEVLRTLNPKVYTLRNDLKNSTPQIAELDTSDWVRIPQEFTGEKYILDVSPARLAYNSAVEKAGRELEVNYKNTSKDFLGREFVGNNNWSNSLKLNLALGLKTPTIKNKIDYLKILYLGSQEKIKVYNASGNQIDSKLCEKYLMDIVKVKSPWRAEWLDADFKTKRKSLYINYNHILDSKGNLIHQNSEILDKNTLMNDKTPGISLENFLESNHTNQGLPTKKVKSGQLYYWYPRSDDNSVARFYAYSVRSVLSCIKIPSFQGSILGVRAVRHE